MDLCIYIYIYIYRERERDMDFYLYGCMWICIYRFMCMCLCIKTSWENVIQLHRRLPQDEVRVHARISNGIRVCMDTGSTDSVNRVMEVLNLGVDLRYCFDQLRVCQFVVCHPDNKYADSYILACSPATLTHTHSHTHSLTLIHPRTHPCTHSTTHALTL